MTYPLFPQYQKKKPAKGKKYFPHTLNNTVVATPRMLIAFIENNLQEDGRILIPKALQPYMGGQTEIAPKKAEHFIVVRSCFCKLFPTFCPLFFYR